MRFRAAPLCGPAAGVVLVSSLRAGLWLIVLGVVAAVAVLIRRELQDRRGWLPALLAVRAVSRPARPSGDAAFEASAAELAVLARGRRDVLERAAALANEEADVERWGRSIDGIVVAADLLEHGAVPGVPSGHPRNPGHLVFWLAAVLACLVGATLTSSAWWLAALVVTYTAAVLAWTERREDRDWGPALVAGVARARPAAPTAPAELVLAHLALIARASVGPVRRARDLVETWPGPAEDKAQGSRRLAMTEALLRESGLAAATARRRAAFWAATVLITTVAWVVSG